MAGKVSIEMAYEQFLCQLFGSKNYHGYVDEVSFPTWRKDVNRVVRTLGRSIQLSINTDPHHLTGLLALCKSAEDSIGSALSHEEAANRAIRYLASIAFLLVGELPDHYFDNQPTHDNYWVLNSERQVGYTQAVSQKARVLLNLERQGVLGMDSKKKPLESNYHLLRGDSEKFIQWVKDNHADIYMKVF